MRSIASSWALGLLLLLCCWCAVGCNNGRQLQSDLYQRELRLQEDEIYRLEDYVAEYQAIIRGYRCELAELKQQLTAHTSVSKETKPTKLEPLGGPKFRSPTTAPAEEEAPRFGLPKVDAPTEPLPTPKTSPADEAPPFIPLSAAELVPPIPGPPVVKLPEEKQASPLVLTSGDGQALETTIPALLPLEAPPVLLRRLPERRVRLTLRNGTPEPTGEPTLQATVHAVSEQDEAFDFASFDGELSLMLTDPTARGALKRVARWDYSDEEVREASQTGPEEGAIELPLLLPRRIPTDRPLRMWVRVVEPSGKKRLTSIDVEFLPSPLRLIHSEPFKPLLSRLPEEAEEKTAQWRRARADRIATLEEPSAVQKATYEE